MSAQRKPRHGGNSLPYPPFASAIIDMIRRGERPNVFVVSGSDAWRRHSNRTERLVLPSGEDPAGYDWSFMRGLAPTIIGDDAPLPVLRKLAWCLLRAECPLVCLLYQDAENANVVRALYFRHPHVR